MAKQIIVTQNDYGIELETQFVDDKKKPLDITDYDVRVKIIYDDKTIDTILAGHKDSVNGIAYIVLEKEHLINAGLHTSVWSVVDEDEHVTAQENVYYFVKDVEGSEDDTPTTDLPIDADGVLNKFNEIDNNLFELTEQVNVVNEEIDSINETLSGVNEQLDNIETEKLDKERSKIIFMPVSNTTDVAGDCSVIITKNKKVIMIDTGATASYDLIKTILKNNDIQKIDYIIITHYHADHCQNLGLLKADFDLSSTKYYLQKHTPKFSYGDNTVLELIGRNEKHYPNNDDVLNVDNIKFTFFNCSQDDIDYYDINSNNYNDYSMCCYCEYFGNKVLFTGDINTTAQSRLNELGYFNKVDLLKVEHHAYDSIVNHDYIRRVNPKYAVVSESELAFTNKVNVTSETLSLLNGLGTKIAITGKEVVEFYMNEQGHSFSHKYSIGGCFKDVANYTYIYVDNNYTGLSDGTYHHPFRSIREALAEISKINSLNIQIIAKNDSFESDEHIRIANLNGTLKLDNITIRGLDVRNSHIILGNVTVTGTHNRAVMIESSTVEFNNLTVNGDCRNAETEYVGRGVTIYKSKFNGTNLNISNKRIALAVYNVSDVYVENLNGSNNEYGLICGAGSRIINNKVTMEYVTAFKDLQKTSYIQGALTNDLTAYLIEGDDLNNFKTINTRYVSKTGAITLSLLNKPNGIGYSIVLEVKKQTQDGSLMQVIKSRHLNGTNQTGIWVRTYTPSDGWGLWYKISLVSS